MIRIRTGSRLHFGLLSLPDRGADERSINKRYFGGAGLMIDQPGIDLTIDRAGVWSSEGPLATRALRIAQDFCAAIGVPDAFAIRVASAAPEHAGLGTGTQLGLAIARGIAELTEQPARDSITLAHAVGRGKRSAIGVHGFDYGGFLVEGGKRLSWKVSPLVFRHDFPDEWSILLITPRELIGTHGPSETEAFANLAYREADERATETLCRLTLLGMMPSIVARDLAGFADALYEFNRRAGEMFRAVQGGVYAHPRIAEIVEFVRSRRGCAAVGQSSWGPTVFVITDAVLGSSIHKTSFAARLPDCDLARVRPRNRGAEVVFGA